MIRVSVSFDDKGLLQRVAAEGHAQNAISGDNIVCAAATILLRTAVRLLNTDNSFQLQSEAQNRGTLGFTVESYDEARAGYLSAVGEFLVQGLSDLQLEYPDECSLNIEAQ